jgi:hypothetical protein
MLQEQNALVRKDPANGVRGLCAVMQPFEGFLTIDLDSSWNSKWIVSSDFLNELTVSWSSGIGYYDKVERSFFTPVSLESDFYSHKK